MKNETLLEEINVIPTGLSNLENSAEMVWPY
jgi:hypothetical protein